MNYVILLFVATSIVTVQSENLSEKVSGWQGFNRNKRLIRVSEEIQAAQFPDEEPIIGRVRRQVAESSRFARHPGSHSHADEDNLERLCKDPFHSFLCLPVGRSRQIFSGKLRPGAVIPPGVLPESSNIRESKVLLQSPTQNVNGYQYPKPMKPFQEGLSTASPLPTTKPTRYNVSVSPQTPTESSGYQYKRPSKTFEEEPSESNQRTGNFRPPSSFSMEKEESRAFQGPSYLYPKPDQGFEKSPSDALPSISAPDTSFPQTSAPPFPKTQQTTLSPPTSKTQVAYQTKNTPLSTGYFYTRPTGSNTFSLPTSTGKPTTLQTISSTEAYFYGKPKKEFTLPYPRTEATSPKSEQLKEEDPKIDVRFGAASFQSNVQSPFPTNENSNIVKKGKPRKDEDNLERLCNDPFHSFLCMPIAQKRQRIDGKIRSQAKLPKNFILGQSSVQRETILTSKPSVNKEAKYINTNAHNPKSNPVFSQPIRKGNGSLRPSFLNASFQFRKPSNSQEAPDLGILNTDATNEQLSIRPQQSGYNYERPQVPFTLPSPTSPPKKPPTLPDRPPSPGLTGGQIAPEQTGYAYEKPRVPFTLPSESRRPTTASQVTPTVASSGIPSRPTFTQTVASATTSGQTSESRFPLPSEPLSTQFSLPTTSKEPTGSTGYTYPKPVRPSPSPTKPQSTKPETSSTFPSTARPPYPSVPTPTTPVEISTGYLYERPSKPFILPTKSRASDFNLKSKNPPTSSGQSQVASQTSRLGMILSNYNRLSLKSNNNSGNDKIPLPPANQFEILTR